MRYPADALAALIKRPAAALSSRVRWVTGRISVVWPCRRTWGGACVSQTQSIRAARGLLPITALSAKALGT